MIPYFPYVFQGGPLDGHEIQAVANAALYRDEAGNKLPAATGDRRYAGRGGLYALDASPGLARQDGQIVRRPGRYRWVPPEVAR